MVQKGAGAALDIFDIPLAAFVPELAVPSAHDFALKADGCCRGHVDWDVRRVVSLGISADANDFGAGRKRSRYGREGERRAGRPGIVEGAEPDRGQDVDAAGAILARGIGRRRRACPSHCGSWVRRVGSCSRSRGGPAGRSRGDDRGNER